MSGLGEAETREAVTKRRATKVDLPARPQNKGIVSEMNGNRPGG